MTAPTHRLEGLEPDNLLAFLALLGLLRALDADDADRPEEDRIRARAAWTVDSPPLKPQLVSRLAVGREQMTERAAAGLERLAPSHDFAGRVDLNYTDTECRSLLAATLEAARYDGRNAADLLAALMSDAAVKDEKTHVIEPTPLCLLLGQGHQHFLERLAAVPRQPTPPPRGRGKKAVAISASECIDEALFQPWHRTDPTPGFRWDPEEDVRYALMAGDPTDQAYKTGTQHGANRLAAVGLAALTVAPHQRGRRVRASVTGGQRDRDGFSFAWPIWSEPATLPAIQAMLSHPHLRKPGELAHLSVRAVVVAKRISVGKFGNFARARPIEVS